MWARWLLAGLVFLCAGCELHLQVDMAFDRDGGGRLAVAVTADEALREAARATGADPLGQLAAAGEELPGWTVTDRTDDSGRRAVELATQVAGAHAYERAVADVAAALSAPEVALLGPLSVAVDDERIVVEGRAALEPTSAVGELGLAPDEAVALLREGDVFRYDVHVTLPGEVLETTADAQQGQRLTWPVEPGSAVTIRAVGERPAQPVWPLVAGGAAGLAVAGVAVRLIARRRR